MILQPSIQKLVNNLAQDCLGHLTEEAVHTDAYMLDTPRVKEALQALESEFSPNMVNMLLMSETIKKTQIRIAKLSTVYNTMVGIFYRWVLLMFLHEILRLHQFSKLP